MPEITWALVAILVLIVFFVLAMVAMIASPKDIVIRASVRELSIQTTTPKATRKT